MSGLFPGGGGGRAGPRRVTASASGRPLALKGGAPCAGWPGLTMPVPARRAGGTGLGRTRPCSLLEVGSSCRVSAAQGRPQKPSGRTRNPNPTFPVFGLLIIRESPASSSRKSPTHYLASGLFHGNGGFSASVSSTESHSFVNCWPFTLFQALGR